MLTPKVVQIKGMFGMLLIDANSENSASSGHILSFGGFPVQSWPVPVNVILKNGAETVKREKRIQNLYCL